MGKIRRILIGALLIAAAAFAAFALKDLLDHISPQYAVPQMTVVAGGSETKIPAVGFHWTFVLGGEAEEMSPSIQAAFERGIVPRVESYGGETIQLEFSQDSSYVLIDRSIEPYNYDFFQPAEHETAIPFEPGFYAYMVDATFAHGRVQYYFTVVVK